LADLAGGDWSVRARASLVEVMTGRAAEDESTGVRLLRDIRSIFEEKDAEELRSEEITAALNLIEESGYAAWNRGNGIKPADLARRLRPYAIEPRRLRFDGEQARGYRVADFEDAFERYGVAAPRQAEEEALPF